jgi:hypothetical protein
MKVFLVNEEKKQRSPMFEVMNEVQMHQLAIVARRSYERVAIWIDVHPTLYWDAKRGGARMRPTWYVLGDEE